MRFSLFYEMQISNPTRASEQQLFHDCVKEVELADEVGFDGVWAVEHHGLREYAHSSAPEVFLAFVAARTKQIQIGHGVTLLPGAYNHPIRIAERVATLDILSEGRVQWGTGKSGTRVEQGAFEIAPEELHEQWLEALHMIPRMWKDEVFSWKGKFYDIPPTQIVPKPWQLPHPPIFAACSRPDLAIAAGRLGLGVLSLAMYHDEKLAQKVAEYRAAVEVAEPIAQTVTNRFCCNPASLVLADDRKACSYGIRGSQFFLRTLAQYYGTDLRPTGPLRAQRELPSSSDVDHFRAHRNTPKSQLSSIIGDPVSARESVQRFVDAGVDELILVMQTGTQPHELIMESIRTVAEHVMPHFK
jgi:alkanesulfonate monooxygenase SsuD/methylene tetrahydromethanopterin reductase-like flavin-dependent oxidoreductase (luciferase family)